jgi:hypothetical protein
MMDNPALWAEKNDRARAKFREPMSDRCEAQSFTTSRSFTGSLRNFVLPSVFRDGGGSMLLIDFTSTVVALAEDGSVLLAFMDGAEDGQRRCVALLRASSAVARALRASLGSGLKEPREQPVVPGHTAVTATPEAQTARDDP